MWPSWPQLQLISGWPVCGLSGLLWLLSAITLISLADYNANVIWLSSGSMKPLRNLQKLLIVMWKWLCSWLAPLKYWKARLAIICGSSKAVLKERKLQPAAAQWKCNGWNIGWRRLYRRRGIVPVSGGGVARRIAGAACGWLFYSHCQLNQCNWNRWIFCQ